MPSSTKNRLAYIDALRGFAILGVILNHAASIAHLGGLTGKLFGMGSTGVQLFFVVSAFTIFLTYERSCHNEIHPVRNFFIRRLMRIVPIYWMGILLYTAVYGMESRGWFPGPEIWHFPMHIFLLNDLHPLTQSSVVPGGWSISCEVVFYLTTPLWFLLVRSKKSAAVFCILSVILGPLVTKILAQLLQDGMSHYPREMVAAFWSRNPLIQLGCFSFGIWLFCLLHTGDKPMFFSGKKGSLIAVILAIALMVGGASRLPCQYQLHFFSAGYMLFAIALSSTPWRIAVNPLTVFMGRISYSAYLFHFLVLKQLTIFLPKGGKGDLTYVLLIGGLGIAITIPLAYFSYLLVEKPAMNMAKRVIKALEVKSHMKRASDSVVLQKSTN